MKNREEVEVEIAKLEDMKPDVRERSAFGDNHHDAIDAQVEVLRESLSEKDVWDRHDNAMDDEPFYAENERDAAIEAARWRDDEDYSDGAPSENWQDLVA